MGPNMVKKTASKKSVEVKTEAPPPEVVEVSKTEEQSDESVENTFKQLYDKINNLKAELSKLSSDVKDVHKQVNKSMKESLKNKKKKADRPKREPSGFAKP